MADLLLLPCWVGRRGFEPPTSSSRKTRATKLRYRPNEVPQSVPQAAVASARLGSGLGGARLGFGPGVFEVRQGTLQVVPAAFEGDLFQGGEAGGEFAIRSAQGLFGIHAFLPGQFGQDVQQVAYLFLLFSDRGGRQEFG